MLQRVDRVQVVVRDAEAAIQTWRAVLGAEPVVEGGEGAVESLRAHRTRLRLGRSRVELLQPTGPGPAADFIGAWGEGLFAAGFSVRDLGAAREQLATRGVRWTEEGDQLLLEPADLHGLRMVLSPFEESGDDGPGALQWLYEVTHVVRSWKEATERHVEVLSLDPARFSEISSDAYGYTGSLLLFDPPARLDRIEVVETWDDDKPMGRFFRRRGEGLYMCYAECADTGALVERLRSTGARFTAPPDDDAPANLFVHPKSLTGVLMGISRTHHAWTWSGRPDLAKS